MTLETQVATLLNNFVADLTQKELHTALEKGAKVIVSAYQGALQVSTPPPGSPSFIHAWTSVGYKVKNFENGAGCYALIGSERGRGGRLKAPQTRFGEHGTKARQTKSGANRGAMPAMNWLQHAINGSLSDAREVVIASLKDGISKYRK